jgi:hypothetical protein
MNPSVLGSQRAGAGGRLYGYKVNPKMWITLWSSKSTTPALVAAEAPCQMMRFRDAREERNRGGDAKEVQRREGG